MSLLNESVRGLTREHLSRLPNPVRLVVFTQELECAHCRENRQLAEELAALSDRLSLETYSLLIDKEKAAEFDVAMVPATAVLGEQDYGIRFYGVPVGFEFTSLLNAIELAGNRESKLKPETRKLLAELDGPVELQVFVTLTCPLCPRAVITATQLAVESRHVTTSIIDAAEFPHLAQRYSVTVVPKIVVNGRHSFEGALPEDQFVAEVLKGSKPKAD